MLPNNIDKTAMTDRYGSKIFFTESEYIAPKVTIIALNAAVLPAVENNAVTFVGDPW
jgi:hypothetical protein